MNKLWYTHTVEYLLMINRSKLINGTKWVNLKLSTLSERSLAQKGYIMHNSIDMTFRRRQNCRDRKHSSGYRSQTIPGRVTDELLPPLDHLESRCKYLCFPMVLGHPAGGSQSVGRDSSLESNALLLNTLLPLLSWPRVSGRTGMAPASFGVQ